MKIVAIRWLTEGDDGLNQKVIVSDDEFAFLERCPGFPYETDPWAMDEHPEWLEEIHERTPMALQADATIVVY